jgi:hypothetical protein
MAKQNRKGEPIKIRWKPGWSAIPDRLIRCTSISRNARLFFCLLVTYAGNDESAWPTQEDICDFLGEEHRTGEVSRRSVHRWETELWRHGWISITRTRYGHEYELHEPVPAEVARRQDLKSPFDDELRCDTGVSSDVTQESHGSDSGVPCHVIEESHASINKDSSTKTHDPDIHGGADHNDREPEPNGDGWMDGSFRTWEELCTTEQGRFLQSIGVRALSAAREFVHTPLEILRDEWERVRVGSARDKAATLILNLRGLPKLPAVEPAAVYDPAADQRRPTWCPLEEWELMTEQIRDMLTGAQLVNGQVVASHPALTERLYSHYALYFEFLNNQEVAA